MRTHMGIFLVNNILLRSLCTTQRGEKWLCQQQHQIKQDTEIHLELIKFTIADKRTEHGRNYVFNNRSYLRRRSREGKHNINERQEGGWDLA